jgi:hypothetical protein
MFVAVIGAKPYSATINTPSGFTELGTQQTNGSTASGADAGSVTWKAFYKIWHTGDPTTVSATVTGANTSVMVVESLGLSNSFGTSWATPQVFHASDTTADGTFLLEFTGSNGSFIAGKSACVMGAIANTDAGTFQSGSASLVCSGITNGPVNLNRQTNVTGDDSALINVFLSDATGTQSGDFSFSVPMSANPTGGGALVVVTEYQTFSATISQSASAGSITNSGFLLSGSASEPASGSDSSDETMTFNMSQGESSAAAHSQSTLMIAEVSADVPASSATSQNSATTAPVSLTDPASSGSSQNGGITFTVTDTEPATSGSSQSASAAFASSATETASAADSPATVVVFVPAGTAVGSASDAPVVVMVAQASRDESASGATTQSSTQVFQLAGTEPLSALDSSSVAKPQVFRPVSDLAQNDWAPSSGPDLYAMIDEGQASDADYIYTFAVSTCEVKLSTGGVPLSRDDHNLRIRLLAGTGAILIALKQGATTIHSQQYALTGSAQDIVMAIPSLSAQNITDYTNLSVAFSALVS